MIVLLIVSVWQAYRIQQTTSQESAEIYHYYVKVEDILYRCRRNMFVGGIDARDFLLSTRPDKRARFTSQLLQLKTESQKALDDLDRLPDPIPAPTALQAKMQDYWEMLDRIAAWSDETAAAQGFEFIQREIAPRRNAAGDLAREFRDASQKVLGKSEAEFARSRRSGTLRLFLMIGLCVFCGLAVASFSLVHSDRLERQTARQYEQLQHLSGRLLEAQEDERRRIARELHDEIGQTLTALRIEVSHAQALWKTGSVGVAERLERALGLAEKTVRTVRDVSLLLRPPLLDDLGLGEALQWHTEDFTRRTGIACDFSGDGVPDSLPEPHKICVYRIVQEALHNCEAHAAATRVRVSLRQERQELAADIEDNGRGLGNPKNRPPEGLGILGMHERAAMLGGTLQLDPAPGGGTRVRLRLPLDHTAAVPKPAPPRKVEVRA